MQKHGNEGRITAFDMLKPADMHQHVRQDDMLKLVVPMVAARFAATIIMPNTTPFITTVAQALEYRVQIDLAAQTPDFLPLMTLYLTDTLDHREVGAGAEAGVVFGIKYYPRGLTTNSQGGVENPASLWTKGTQPYQCLRTLAQMGGVFLIHAADGVAAKDWSSDDREYDQGQELDPWDQERHFIEETLPRIMDAHPKLKISVEHMSTGWGAEFVQKNGCDRLGCSLTAHHLLLDRRDLFRGGFHPHRSWMPVIQPLEHTQELRSLAKVGHPFVWLGSDSAPHPRASKEAACCASGVFMAHAGIELYAEAFEDMGALDHRFEEFASVNGPAFFGLPPSRKTIRLVRESWRPQPLFFGSSLETGEMPELIPFRSEKGDQPIRWMLA